MPIHYRTRWTRQSGSHSISHQVVTPAQSLVTIVPDGTALIVEATVSNEDIGYLKVGQPVEVKVDTFPFQRYGSHKGTLISINPDAEDKNAASRETDTRAGAGSQQYVTRPGQQQSQRRICLQGSHPNGRFPLRRRR
jgi:hypothetical protein